MSNITPCRVRNTAAEYFGGNNHYDRELVHMLETSGITRIAADLTGRKKPYATNQDALQALTKASTRGGGTKAVGYVGEIISGIALDLALPFIEEIKLVWKPDHDIAVYGDGITVGLEAKLARLNKYCAFVSFSEAQLKSGNPVLATLIEVGVGVPTLNSFFFGDSSVIDLLASESKQSRKGRYVMAIPRSGNGQIGKAVAPHIYSGAGAVEGLLDAIARHKAFRKFA